MPNLSQSELINSTKRDLTKPADFRAPIWSAAMLLLWIMPAFVWLSQTDISYYLYNASPDGQVSYLLSKLAGLYASLLLWCQAMFALAQKTPWRRHLPKWCVVQHRAQGSLIWGITTVHIGCFLLAASVRAGHFSQRWLWPSWDDYYRTAVSIGWFAYMAMLVALVAVFIRRLIPQFWKVIHRFMLICLILGLLHGFAIGTETRLGLYTGWHLFMIVSLITMLSLAVRHGWRPWS